VRLTGVQQFRENRFPVEVSVTRGLAETLGAVCPLTCFTFVGHEVDRDVGSRRRLMQGDMDYALLESINAHEGIHVYQLCGTSYGFWERECYDTLTRMTLNALIGWAKQRKRDELLHVPITGASKLSLCSENTQAHFASLLETLASVQLGIAVLRGLPGVQPGQNVTVPSGTTPGEFTSPWVTYPVPGDLGKSTHFGARHILEGAARYIGFDFIVRRHCLKQNDPEAAMQRFSEELVSPLAADPTYNAALLQAIRVLGYRNAARDFLVLCDLALNPPLSFDQNPSKPAFTWKRFHPGWRYLALLDAAKDTSPLDLDSLENDYSRFVRDLYTRLDWADPFPWHLASRIREYAEEVSKDRKYDVVYLPTALALARLREEKPWVFAMPMHYLKELEGAGTAPVLLERVSETANTLLLPPSIGRSQYRFKKLFLVYMPLMAVVEQTIGTRISDLSPSRNLACHHQLYQFPPKVDFLQSHEENACCRAQCEFDDFLYREIGLQRKDFVVEV